MLFWVGSSFVGWGQLQIDGTHSTAGTGNFEYTALTSAEKLLAQTGIIIHPNEKLIIDSMIQMNSNTKIEVLVGSPGVDGGQLDVSDNLACSYRWDGIVVYGDEDFDHYLVPPDPSQLNNVNAFMGVLNPIHGRVTLSNGCYIENAKHGVESFDGGIVESFADRLLVVPTFYNCKEGIMFNNSQQNPSAQRIMNCDFVWDENALSTHYVTDFYTFAHVWLANSKGVYLGGCKFYNNSSLTSNVKEDRGYGVINSSGDNDLTIGEAGNTFFLVGNCITPKMLNQSTVEYRSLFQNMSYGVRGIGIDHLIVDKTDFIDNHTGLYNVLGSTSISNSSFECDDANVKIQNHPKFSVNLENIMEFLCYNSQFKFRNINNTLFPIGSHLNINANNNAGKILIQNNEFEGLTTGSIITPYAITANGNLTNFEWTCNLFNEFDIAVSYSGDGPAINPNHKTTYANNTYSGIVTLWVNNQSNQVPLYYKDWTSLGDVGGNSFEVTSDDDASEAICLLDCDEVAYIRENLLVKKLGNQLIVFYPNPAEDKVNIPMDRQEMLKGGIITLMTIDGKMALQQSFNAGESVIDISTLSSGTYIVEITADGKSFSGKIIKK
jgi:hypothetical protein